MKPKFTQAQLDRQNRWRREEQFSLATTIINVLMFVPFVAILFPGIIQLAGIVMSWVDFGLKANRNKILHAEQKALNASKKQMLIKKDNLLKQLAKFDVTTTTTTTQMPKPTNINFSATNKEGRLVGGGITKKRHIDTTLTKPSNIMFYTLKKDLYTTPTNI